MAKLRIERHQRTSFYFQELPIGEVFYFGDDILIKTSTVLDDVIYAHNGIEEAQKKNALSLKTFKHKFVPDGCIIESAEAYLTVLED